MGDIETIQISSTTFMTHSHTYKINQRSVDVLDSLPYNETSLPGNMLSKCSRWRAVEGESPHLFHRPHNPKVFGIVPESEEPQTSKETETKRHLIPVTPSV